MRSFSPVEITYQWLGTVDEGRQLEILTMPGYGDPLMSFFKDESTESLYVEFYTERGPVQISAQDLRKALEVAERETHSERWYEENVYNKMETEPDSPADGSLPVDPE